MNPANLTQAQRDAYCALLKAVQDAPREYRLCWLGQIIADMPERDASDYDLRGLARKIYAVPTDRIDQLMTMRRGGAL